MINKNKHIISFLLILLIIFIFIDLTFAQSVPRVPQGIVLDENDEVSLSVIVTAQAQGAEFYIGGRPIQTQLLGYRKRSTLGQRFIGVGFDETLDLRVELGYLKMLNTPPVIENITVDAFKEFNKHPHTNDTLICRINITEKDIGDRLTILVKWYKSNISWYNNSLEIDYYNLTNIVEQYDIQFDEWPYNQEIWNHTMIGKDFYETSTSPYRIYGLYDKRNNVLGSISPEDTTRYELWFCSAQVFDGTVRTEWVNSTPIFIFNHKPDYDNSMRTYYSWKEDTQKIIDIGSYFSDIDNDDINYYIDYVSGQNPGRFTIFDIGVSINNETGNILLNPFSNITGYMDIRFTAVDRNDSITSDWYLRNDYGHTRTNNITLNILQVNDPPWASDVYISSTVPGYTDTLQCLYTYDDLENHPENTTVTSYKWWIQYQGLGDWYLIEGENSSLLTSDHFNLNDRVICGVRVKDIYYDWPGYTWLRTNAFGRLIGSTYQDENNWEQPYETNKNVVSENEWYHIVNSIDLSSNERKIYVNGKLVKESNDNVNILDEENLINWRLGQRDGSFNGIMDEVGIWNRKLDAIEIFELYTMDRFGYKFQGETFTGIEPIVKDNDGSGLYTDSADFVFVNNTNNLPLNAGDKLYKITKNHRIFADSTNPNNVSCIYTATKLQMNDGNVPSENYFLGNNCSSYAGTFILPGDIQITEEHNWVINTPNIDLSETSFIYESNHGSLTYSAQADVIIHGSPTAGEKLSNFPHNIVYYDNFSTIVNDTNCDLIFNQGTDVVLRGSNPPNNAILTRFSSSPSIYPFEGSLNNVNAYYHFNNDFESTTNNHHGTNYNTNFAKGIGCKAVQFSKESYIDLDLSKENEYTISMWVKFDSLPEFPWQYTPEFLPNMPWLYSGDDVDQSLWSLDYTNSSAVTIVLETTDPTDEGQIVIGVG